MKIKISGVAAIIVVISTSAILIGLIMLWRGVSMSLEGALLCHRTRRYFYATESLTLYGLALIKHGRVRLDQLRLKRQPIYLGSWPKLNTQTTGRLSASYDAKGQVLGLWAELFDLNGFEAISVIQVTCQVLADKKIKVIAWKNG